MPPDDHPLFEPLRMRSAWNGKSRVEILPGTISPNSGPHPQAVYADEVELIPQVTWDKMDWMRIVSALGEDTKATRRLAVALGVETDEYGQVFGADGSVLLCACGAATITTRASFDHCCPGDPTFDDTD